VPIQQLSFANLKAGYPTGPGADVWKKVTGKESGADSCTIRLSLALHNAKHEIRKRTGVYCIKGIDEKWYMARADEVAQKYFPAVFTRKPDVTAKGNEAEIRKAISNKSGVLFFRLTKQPISGRHKGKILKMSAFNHADLWDGSNVHYNDILYKAYEVWLWQTAK